MKRRQFLAGMVGVAGALSAGTGRADEQPRAATAPSGEPETNRPNILFILMDDLGWGDMGCYGHPVLKTPNMDKLAAEGCRFTDFYVAMPLCSPTRAACLTGRDPNRYGFKHVINTGMVNPNVKVPEVHHLPIEEPTYPRQLQKSGYKTGTVGKWHLSMNWIPSEPKPSDYGFDHYFVSTGGGSLYHGPAKWSRNGTDVEISERQWYPEVYVDEAIAFIKSCGDQPFCLNVWPFTPHVTEEAAEAYRQMYAGHTEAEKTYYGCITQMDEQIGRLLRFLDSSGLSEKTVVILASDNGPEPPVNIYHHEQARRGSTGGLRGSKHVIYEGGIRVPGIVRWPGRTKAGSVSSVPVSVLDLMPTLCATAGAEVPSKWNYDGADMRPALRGEAIQRPHSLYWQCEYAMRTFMGPDYHSPPLALRKGQWKVMCDLQFGNPKLYGLEWDRGEQFTVDKEYPEIVEPMLAELKTIYADVNGPYSKTAKYLNPEILKQHQ